MSTTQWIITLVLTLIVGGAMGSVIGIIATNRRNRIQPYWHEKRDRQVPGRLLTLRSK